MTCQWRSRSRTLAASSTQRLVSHAQGHSGSNQKSTRAFTGALCTASVIVRYSSRVRRSGEPPAASTPEAVPVRLSHSVQDARRGRSPARGKLSGVAVPNLTRDDAAARAELLAVQSYDLQLDVTDGAGHPGSVDLRVDDDGRVQLPPARRGHVHRPGRRRACTRRRSTAPRSTSALHRGGRPAAARAGRAEHAGRRRRLPLLQHRRGPAPLRGPGGRAGLPLLALRAGRGQADVRLLRPARPQGRVHGPRHRAVRLAGRLEHRRPDHRGRPRRQPAGALRADQAHLHLPGRADRRPVRAGHRRRTTASRWGCTAAPRWPSTSTRTSCSG